MWDLILVAGSETKLLMAVSCPYCSLPAVRSIFHLSYPVLSSLDLKSELAVGDHSATKCLANPTAALMQHLAGFLS